MVDNVHDSLIFAPTPRIAQLIVRRISFLFLIHLPLSANKFVAVFASIGAIKIEGKRYEKVSC